jgi:hypothetical protein
MTRTAEKAQLIGKDESYVIIGVMFTSDNLVSFRVLSGPKFL